MVYLDKFILPDDEQEYALARARREHNGGYLDNGYPCGLFRDRELRELDFESITIFYGGNGSGKSTLLNLIALRLALKRIAPYNGSELMEAYAKACAYRLGYDDAGESFSAIPSHSRILTSDDVFEYMLAARGSNEELREDIEEAKDEYAKLKYGKNLRFESMDSYEDFRLQVLARRRSLTRRRFLREQMGAEVTLASNGETALDFFASRMENDTLYCLDEPENSLSPRMQLELKALLEEKRRYCGAQLIIATHSPFLLSLSNAKIYDLDAAPVDVKRWWELDNARVYFAFFEENRALFRH